MKDILLRALDQKYFEPSYHIFKKQKLATSHQKLYKQ